MNKTDLSEIHKYQEAAGDSFREISLYKLNDGHYLVLRTTGLVYPEYDYNDEVVGKYKDLEQAEIVYQREVNICENEGVGIFFIGGITLIGFWSSFIYQNVNYFLISILASLTFCISSIFIMQWLLRKFSKPKIEENK